MIGTDSLDPEVGGTRRRWCRSDSAAFHDRVRHSASACSRRLPRGDWNLLRSGDQKTGRTAKPARSAEGAETLELSAPGPTRHRTEPTQRHPHGRPIRPDPLFPGHSGLSQTGDHVQGHHPPAGQSGGAANRHLTGSPRRHETVVDRRRRRRRGTRVHLRGPGRAGPERPLVPIRKPGKLPYDKIGIEYDLEYGKGPAGSSFRRVAAGQKCC